MSSYVDKIFKKEILSDVLGKSDDKISEECNFFRELCEEKIEYSQSTEDLTKHENFIAVVDRLNCKFPFFNIQEFINDYVNGIYNKNMIIRYQLSKHDDVSSCLSKTNLNLPRKRQKILYEKDKSGFARRRNLSNAQVEERYSEILGESEYFKEELDYLLHYNIARALILLKLLKNKIEINIIQNDPGIIINDQLEFSFLETRIHDGLVLNDDKIKEIIQDKFIDILTELKQKNILQFENNKYKFELTSNEIEESLLEIINNEIDGISYGNIISGLIIKYPVISLIPHYDLLDEPIKKYVDLGIIKVEEGFGYTGITANFFYSVSNYQKSNELIEKITQGRRKFFGRPNTDSFRFVEDIRYLPKGDFADEDDQVTRIAGLILAGTQKLISEHEEHEEFDFAVDMTGFSPNEEEIKKMQEAKFVLNPNSKIIHVKVMINEEVTNDIIELAENILPKDEQLIIISFKEISEKIKNILPSDSSIQIIDKRGIQLWSEIIPVMPSRKGSIIRVMDGKYVGKIAKLNHVNYETGKANIELIPSFDEVTTYVGHLEEINLFDDPIIDDFSIMSDNYFEFLKIIAMNSEINEYQKAIFNFEEIIATFNEEMVDFELKEGREFRAKIQGISCTINPNGDDFKNIFYCTCDYFQNKSNFCIHLISILNEIGIRNNHFSETWGKKDKNLLFACLEKIYKL